MLSADLDVSIPAEPDAGGLDEAQRVEGLEPVRDANNARLLDALGALRPAQDSALLDVGCGPGMLLRAARARGYVATGVEPDANVLATARAAGTVRHGYFPSALSPGEAFDVMIFNDVFEHIPDLRGTLRGAAAHLNEDGLLCLNCPDQRGFLFRTAALLDRLGVHGPYDRLWQRGMPSPHVWYFTPRHLRMAAEAAGFEHVGDVRLATIKLRGLWARIRYVRTGSFITALAAYAFTVASAPLAALLPSDSTASLFRKKVGAVEA